MSDSQVLTFVQQGPSGRSAIACQRCKSRKVRCNVVTSGPPCANCLHDNVDCKVLPRKTRGQRVARKSELRGISSKHSSENLTSWTSRQDSIADAVRDDLTIGSSTTTDGVADFGGGSVTTSAAQDEGENTTLYADALQDDGQSNQARPVYVGDQQGIFHAVRDICGSLSTNFVPSSPETQLRPPKAWCSDDLLYLQSKGVFDLPSNHVCDALLKTYFKHVHPFLPIVDASQFLSQYVNHGASTVNLLLLWSMFLAAANFASPDTLQTAGCSTRKALKRQMYSKAKALYDSDYEDDKVCLVQSVTLMAFWFSDAADRNGPWHWIGIAIGLCQVMGLYRNPRQSSTSPGVSQRFCLARRIWWSCFLRDRWLSLGLGRPMRISLEDCDVQLPAPEDVTNELDGLDDEIKKKFLPPAMNEHAQVWSKLIKLTRVLGIILHKQYRQMSPEIGGETIKKCEAELEALRLTDTEMHEKSDFLATLNRYQFCMLLETAEVVLQRPMIDYRSPDPGAESAESFSALEKARASATRTNRILEKLIELDMVASLPPMSVTSIIPAMQIHLLDYRSGKSLLRNLAWSKLELCMMVLSELRDTYWGANFTFKLFDTARTILKNTHVRANSTRTPSIQSNAISKSRANSLTDSNAGVYPASVVDQIDTSSTWLTPDYSMYLNDANMFDIFNAGNDQNGMENWSLNGFHTALNGHQSFSFNG